MSTIKRSKTDAFSVKESVNIVKLAEAAFEQISLDQLTDVVVETPTDGDILVYSSDLMAWENVPQASGIGGSDTYVQFNDGGALGADAGLTYDKATGTLSATQTKTASVAGPDTVTGTQLRAGAGGTLSTLGVDPSAIAPYFVTGGSVYEVQHTGNTKTVAGQSINGSGNVVLTDADVPAAVVADATSARTIVAGDAGKYIRFTATGAKTCTFDNTLTAGEYHIRNAAASGDVTLTASSTTLNAPAGGTLVLEPGMTCTIKFVGTAEFDVIGQTVAA